MRIYILCLDSNSPIGGVKQLYRHVDILNQAGFPASILHRQPGFRCTWFENDTRVSHVNDVMFKAADFLVIPEVCKINAPDAGKGVKKIIFNQNAYNTFIGYSLDKDDLSTLYLDEEIVATLVVSENNKQYLQYVFPKLKIFRIHNGIDQSIFSYEEHKKPLIAYMPRKHHDEVEQVINILKFRGALKNYDLAPIDGMTEAEVAAVLKESLIFLSFGYPEGSPLPPAEAMACGCVVIGYDGMGGRENFKPEFSYPVTQGDVVEFAKTVEEVLGAYEKTPDVIRDKGRNAADFIKDTYSMEKEKLDVIEAWINIMEISLLNAGQKLLSR